MTTFTESVVEEAALDWLEAAGWRIAYGPDIAPDMPAAERRNYGEVVLKKWFEEAVARLNPALPLEARQDAVRKVMQSELPSLLEENRRLHKLISGELRVKDAETFLERVAA